MNQRGFRIVIGILLALLAAWLLVACDGSDAEQEENCDEGYNDLKTYHLRICADGGVHDFGEPVYITLTVTAVSDDSLTLDGGDEPVVDICVRDECWSDEQELVPDLTIVTLEPGESHTLNWAWPTTNTDLKELKRQFPPEVSAFGPLVRGSVAPGVGASPRTVATYVAYRRP